MQSRLSPLDLAGATADDVEELNEDLDALSCIFPNIDPEAFRELLQHVSRKSRRHAIADRLLVDQEKWVQGRHRYRDAVPLQPAERFRTPEYKRTVSQLLHHEFKGLSKSSIKAVLAEHNHCYSQCRPALTAVSNKSWRVFFSNIFLRKKDRQTPDRPHPLITWQASPYGVDELVPVLLPTSNSELDSELHRCLVEPIRVKHRAQALARDRILAVQLNETEAEAAGALYDCECCFSATVFEELAVCSGHGHFLCFSCVRHAAREALFGQSWSMNVDTDKVAIRCLAPSSEPCTSSISSNATRRAILEHPDDNGDALWRQFQDRVILDELQKSRLPLSRCPFCSYAEVDDSINSFHARSFAAFVLCLAMRVSMVMTSRASSLWRDLEALALVLSVLLSPILYLLLLASACHPDLTTPLLRTSFHNAVRRKRGLRFTCRSPDCSKPSCALCHQPWKDPHTCSSSPATAPSLDSLRHEIEQATTRAIKRTCPSCNLSFVKDSGCNKFVCATCGYVMCYVCRHQIDKAEGYSHFCTHFRPDARRRSCAECSRCDLYAVEDEAEVIRRAAEAAQREWMARAAADGRIAGVSRREVGDVAKVVLGDRRKGMFARVMMTITNGLDVLHDAFLLG